MTVTTILSDGAAEFTSAKGALANAGLRWNIAAPNTHVPEAERAIRQIKERCRAIPTTLPYILPLSVIPDMVFHVVTMINLVPREGERVSPRQAITGREATATIDYAIAFGAYVHVPIEHKDDALNTMAPRTTGAICVGHAGRLQRAYNFLSLATWKVMTRSDWEEIPMTQSTE